LEKTYILNRQQIQLKMERLALEIAERNTDSPTLLLVGVQPNGSIMANQLAQRLKAYFSGVIHTAHLWLDKRHPGEVRTYNLPDLHNVSVVIVDDVGNSGKTLTYALKPFLDHHPAKIQTCVLVDRTHKRFPIHPDYVGFSLATTIQEYIDVEVQDGELVGAWMA
jgi:pyrimidine operon attenuation protein/uracil phosphoribosyltransferase